MINSEALFVRFLFGRAGRVQSHGVEAPVAGREGDGEAEEPRG